MYRFLLSSLRAGWQLLALIALSAAPAVLPAQHAHATEGTVAAPLLDGLGNHTHKITTSNALAQRYFNQGLALAYGFNHPEALRSFVEASRVDSTCAMCAWGEAFVLGPNINAPMDTAANAQAYHAAQRAVALSKNATEMERAFIGAMATRYAPAAPANRASLDTAFAHAMRDVFATYPDDYDVATIYAESMMDLTPWVYWAKDKSPLPGTTGLVSALEKVMKANPNHPGACHLYIHAVEAAHPRRAVACAERLASLMPNAGHVVHMPAHIYLRVGRYDDAIKANEHAVHADQTYIADQKANSFYTLAYYPHNYHFLAFAATMGGRFAKAVDAARSGAKAIPLDVAKDVPDLQLIIAYPHLTLATFGRWDEILREPMPRADLRLASALAWYARGVASAAKKDFKGGAAALDSIRAVVALYPQYPIAPVLAIATHSLAGEIAAHRGDRAKAIEELTTAMKMEDELSYMEPPFWQQPVRHRLGVVLLDAGRVAEAEKVFREDLERFPENVFSKRGLARSLEAKGKKGRVNGNR